MQFNLPNMASRPYLQEGKEKKVGTLTLCPATKCNFTGIDGFEVLVMVPQLEVLQNVQGSF